jgi:hypothetical protein
VRDFRDTTSAPPPRRPVRVAWRSNDELEVTYDARAWILVMAVVYNGVKVTYHTY